MLYPFFFQSPMVSEKMGKPSCGVSFDFILFNVLKINLQPAILLKYDLGQEKKKGQMCIQPP